MTASGTRTATLHQVDVFTRRRFTGNPAAVVLDADRLSEVEMAAIAREMNLSETAFVFAETASGEVPVRFFTPQREVPACGHATLGAHFDRSRGMGSATGRCVQVSPGARWEVRWRHGDGGSMMVMAQGPVELGQVWRDELREELLAALGLAADELLPGAPIQTISTGHAKIVVPVRTPDLLFTVVPDLGALRALSERVGVAGYFLFAIDGIDAETLTACRMFGPAIGIAEDPVNGSGHGPLGAYLAARGGELERAAKGGFWSRMGDHRDRPGRVEVGVASDARAVDVGGLVTPVFGAELELP